MNTVMLTLTWPAWLEWLVSRVESFVWNTSLLRDVSKLGLVLAVTILLEIASRKDWKIRYGSRAFRIDFLYFVFYYGGFYHVFFFAWLYMALDGLVVAHAPWLKMNLLSSMSPVLQVITMIMVAEFVGYWSHRWRHSNPYLWAFHSIHHSQTTLTAVTNYRFHFVDETLLRLWLFIPFQMLGTGLTLWLWVDFLMAWVLLAQHSDWNWSYGRLGRVFVSPRFHRIHHAKDERLHNCNYSMLFSFWDDLFGTANRTSPVPTEHGIAGDPVPEGLLGQFVYPFAEIARNIRQRMGSTPAVPPATPAE